MIWYDMIVWYCCDRTSKHFQLRFVLLLLVLSQGINSYSIVNALALLRSCPYWNYQDINWHRSYRTWWCRGCAIDCTSVCFRRGGRNYTEPTNTKVCCLVSLFTFRKADLRDLTGLLHGHYCVISKSNPGCSVLRPQRVVFLDISYII